jgi:hypothetical protein
MMEAARNANRSCNDNGASYEDAHGSPPFDPGPPSEPGHKGSILPTVPTVTLAQRRPAKLAKRECMVRGCHAATALPALIAAGVGVDPWQRD